LINYNLQLFEGKFACIIFYVLTNRSAIANFQFSVKTYLNVTDRQTDGRTDGQRDDLLWPVA